MICIRCKIEKTVEDYRPSNQKVCRECLIKANKKYQPPRLTDEEKTRRKLISKEKNKARSKEWYQENKLRFREEYQSDPVRFLIYRAKQRAKKYSLPFDLKPEDIVLPEFCPVLGIKLAVSEGKDWDSRKYSYSLDRIIPEMGYVVGNVQVISTMANAMKNDANFQELHSFARWIISNIPANINDPLKG